MNIQLTRENIETLIFKYDLAQAKYAIAHKAYMRSCADWDDTWEYYEAMHARNALWRFARFLKYGEIEELTAEINADLDKEPNPFIELLEKFNA
jgi:hypothetical protein